jgi:hypothetical protein
MVLTDEGLRVALLSRCRKLRIEPPGRVERIMGACRARFEREFCLQVLDRLSADSARAPPATPGVHEHQIRRRQREVLDQLVPGDLRERPQLLQLLLREHLL